MDQADSSLRPHRPQASSPVSRYRRVAGPAGPRGAVASWAAMKSASLTSAGCAGCLEMTQPSGRFHRCTCLWPSPVLAGSTRSRSVRCRFHTCRPVYRGFARIAVTVRSVHAAPVRCGFRLGSAADGHGIPASFRARVIRAALCPASRWANIHAHHRCRRRVRLEPVRPPAPCGVRLVRVRPGVGQPVPVRRAAAQVPALLSGLGRHRGPDPDPGPGDLPLGLTAPAPASSARGPLCQSTRPPASGIHSCDAVMLEQRCHRGVLAAVERPLVLPDHDRVPAPVRVSQRRHQGRGLRTPCPRQRPALPYVEELRHDHTVPGHQRGRLVKLTRLRCHRILPVLRRHAPVEREPRTCLVRLCCLAAALLRPGRQHITTGICTRTGRRGNLSHLRRP